MLQNKAEGFQKKNSRLKNIIANLVIDFEIKSEEAKGKQIPRYY